MVLRVWNVDTFEGGKGSRTAFLREAGERFYAESGVYVLAMSYTAEGARAAAEKGEAPDLLSFGVGLGLFSERCIPLPEAFSGGMAGEKTLALPWCRGEYLLFSLDENFEEEGRTAISAGGQNVPAVAALLAGIEGEEHESMEAYTGFLAGKYRYLLGTQRDRCRFAARGTAVYEKKLEGYCDLYQCAAVLSEEKREDAAAFLAFLRAEETQEELGKIGMLPYAGGGQTVSIFSSEEALGELRNYARAGDKKIPEKFLKTI